MRIYFAGPLFTPYERSFIDACAKRLRDAGMEVFVPHEIPLPDPVTPEFIFDIDSSEVLTTSEVSVISGVVPLVEGILF